MGKQKIISWFSGGAASAVATKLALQKYKSEEYFVDIVFIETGSHHSDMKRFIEDCEKWFDREVKIIQNEEYNNHIEVLKKRRYIVDPRGAPCTLELKKNMRLKYEQKGDIQILGYTLDSREVQRANKFKKNYPYVGTDFILISEGLTKENCYGILWKQGIKLPKMYELGFHNNNCIGCPKGGAGYWNHIKKHFPGYFEEMAKLERELGYSILNKYLDELDGTEGKHKDFNISCDFVCDSINNEL